MISLRNTHIGKVTRLCTPSETDYDAAADVLSCDILTWTDEWILTPHRPLRVSFVPDQRLEKDISLSLATAHLKTDTNMTDLWGCSGSYENFWNICMWRVMRNADWQALFFVLYGLSSVVVALRLMIRLRYGVQRLFVEDVLIMLAWVRLSLSHLMQGYLYRHADWFDPCCGGWSGLFEPRFVYGRQKKCTESEWYISLELICSTFSFMVTFFT